MTMRSCTAWTASTQVSSMYSDPLSHTRVCLCMCVCVATVAAAAWSIENCRTGCYPVCRRRHSGVPYTCAAGVVSSGGDGPELWPNYVLKTPNSNQHQAGYDPPNPPPIPDPTSTLAASLCLPYSRIQLPLHFRHIHPRCHLRAVEQQQQQQLPG